VPPDVLAQLAEEGEGADRTAALNTIAASATLRAQRSLVQQLGLSGAEVAKKLGPPPGEKRTIYDMKSGGLSTLPGNKVRGEGDPASRDDAVNQAYEGADHTYDFYKDVLHRTSLDDGGMELVSSVHYGKAFDNAFWNGSQMVYGDGSGRIIAKGSLTKDIAVIAHEMTHGVVQFTAGLRYSKQSGALNESFADVFGTLVKQYVNKEAVEDADWLIGEGVLGTALLPGTALRSMKDPGTAFKYDNQPADMDHYMDLPDDNDPQNDNGGVHINSGIPNKAFYLAAMALGGHSWEKAGPIWYDTLVNKLRANSQFDDAAHATVDSAGALYGKNGKEQKAVLDAWREVGVL
jgi:Zn-dependent metalloprotease